MNAGAVLIIIIIAILLLLLIIGIIVYFMMKQPPTNPTDSTGSIVPINFPGTQIKDGDVIQLSVANNYIGVCTSGDLIQTTTKSDPTTMTTVKISTQNGKQIYQFIASNGTYWFTYQSGNYVFPAITDPTDPLSFFTVQYIGGNSIAIFSVPMGSTYLYVSSDTESDCSGSLIRADGIGTLPQSSFFTYTIVG
jgi:hypothetical protein